MVPVSHNSRCDVSLVQLRMEEKRIVSGTMDAVRARLAPIRGIPTKQGNLQDPNSVGRRPHKPSFTCCCPGRVFICAAILGGFSRCMYHCAWGRGSKSACRLFSHGVQRLTVALPVSLWTTQDLKEIFDTLEGLPSLPSKVFGGFASWARGEKDPDWKKKGKKAPDSKRPW